MNKILVFLILVSLIFLVGCSGKIDGSLANKVPVSGNVKEFNIIAKQWEFQPSTIEVNKGDTVRLNIQSIDVFHGISIPDFGVSQGLSPEQTTKVEFIADKTGEFSFSCNIFCGGGHGGMNGKLIVN